MLVKEQEKDPAYPLVSLFNLDEDPQESNNLAKEYPDLVRELLEEAEKLIEKAPRTIKGDLVDLSSPMSPQQNIWATLRTLGSHFETVIPFGIYLDDDVKISSLDYKRLHEQNDRELKTIFGKVFLVYFVLPLVLLVFLLKLK